MPKRRRREDNNYPSGGYGFNEGGGAGGTGYGTGYYNPNNDYMRHRQKGQLPAQRREEESLPGGRGRALSEPGVLVGAQNCGSGDGGRPGKLRSSGERDCAHEEGRRRPQAQRSLSWKGGGRRHPAAAAMTTTLETTVRWLARRHPHAAK